MITNDDDFEITLPSETRYENRTAPAHTRSQWKFRLDEFHHRCAYCGVHQRNTPEGWLTRDHVQPIQRDGTDAITNVVPACWGCNQRKSYFVPGEVTLDGWRVPVPRPRKRKVPG